ncbi:bile acid:sodium symporter family protein [Allochromatium humboldtianum]|uniref:Bile acid:sodium symporter family protein n=1 Tax=Allochromatium humboldtianum TaxID=504901 RepID=A0A850RAL9_9GAMM|nr:bile acid:sodium symporter family protein [Allochromatium humboldtianum]NVZ08287.1 bile acid:sodium symporter family protein [Allochromatium humboldtianum]
MTSRPSRDTIGDGHPPIPGAILTRLFPLWALLAGLIGFIAPETLSDWRAAVMPLLGVVMFGMGATLRPADFLAIARRPALIGLGLCLQFGLMPLIGWSLAQALALPPELLVGMVLVGAAPGGTASNVICYLARGDVALSISLTAASTLLAVVLTPWLTWVYADAWVTVPVGEMLKSIALVVLLPVIAGVVVNRFAGRRLGQVRSWMPGVSVLAILVIIAIVVALNAGRLATVGLGLVVAVMLHNGLGLTLGYWGARAFGQDAVRARTLAIEVGMQNSGLAAALALKSFPAAAALPGALFSVWHNLSGAMLAAWWSRRTPTNVPSPARP